MGNMSAQSFGGPKNYYRVSAMGRIRREHALGPCLLTRKLGEIKARLKIPSLQIGSSESNSQR
jgi:hypothetical protein